MDDQACLNITVLPADCSIYDVEQWRQTLSERIHSSTKELQLDFADVERIDSCFTQLLLTLKKQTIDLGITLSLRNVGKTVVQKLTAMHLYDLLAGAENKNSQ